MLPPDMFRHRYSERVKRSMLKQRRNIYVNETNYDYIKINKYYAKVNS